MTNPQEAFFSSLKSSMPEHLNLPQVVSQILEISLNEAYKKIKGASSLSVQQLAQICDELRFPYSYQPNGAELITFAGPKADSEKNEMENYLQDMLSNMQAIYRSKNKHIKITTDDIPIFHFFKYPQLAAFKLFFWADSMDIPKEDFEDFKLSEEINALLNKMHMLYLEIPSTEIWSKDTVHGTIEQIRYAFEAGHLSNKDLAETLLIQLQHCLNDVNSYAVNSRKTANHENTFNWYCCDVLGSICYLADQNGVLTSFNRFNTFNYIKTQHAGFCKQTNRWMNGLIKKSVSFSGNGEKQRNKYRKEAFGEIEGLRREIWG